MKNSESQFSIEWSYMTNFSLSNYILDFWSYLDLDLNVDWTQLVKILCTMKMGGVGSYTFVDCNLFWEINCLKLP